jgi:hypothetical protein
VAFGGLADRIGKRRGFSRVPVHRATGLPPEEADALAFPFYCFIFARA